MENTYTIIVYTNEKQYQEYIYSINETLTRVDDIKDCDNILAIDVMDNATGEVVLQTEKGKIIYITSALAIELANDIYGC